MFDVDPNAKFAEAVEDIAAGDYEYAVDSLRMIEYPSDGDFEIEEYFVNLAHALMGMGDFHAGMVESFNYALADPAPENVDLLTPRLQLLGGVSAYYSGHDEVAASALAAYIEEVTLELLRDAGRSSEANRLIRDARRAQPDVDWDSAVQI